jgi:diguanylate cyclase (GGDEF)-like protein
MRESLYDRFRPFKPYDLALALVLVVLVAASVQAGPLEQGLLLGIGLIGFLFLDFIQRVVRVPTPLWQALTIVFANTVVISFLVHLRGTEQFLVAFYMLNVGFATVAFGEQLGLAAALLSVAALAQIDFIMGNEPRGLAESALLLALLITLVAMLVRVNRLQQDALLDAVTGLRNHRYFQDRLREELKRRERTGMSTGLVILDLDDFKRVNDKFGHAVGDAVLRLVAQTLLQNARAADVVCRYGGEEMAVILPDTALQDAYHVAERLRRAVNRLPRGEFPVVSISAGVAACPETSDLADELIADADAAMYAAKKAGKNRVNSAVRRAAASV